MRLQHFSVLHTVLNLTLCQNKVSLLFGYKSSTTLLMWCTSWFRLRLAETSRLRTSPSEEDKPTPSGREDSVISKSSWQKTRIKTKNNFAVQQFVTSTWLNHLISLNQPLQITNQIITWWLTAASLKSRSRLCGHLHHHHNQHCTLHLALLGQDRVEQ